MTRDRGSAVHVFSAKASQADVAVSELAALADRLGEGSIAPLILHLVARKRLTGGSGGNPQDSGQAREVNGDV